MTIAFLFSLILSVLAGAHYNHIISLRHRMLNAEARLHAIYKARYNALKGLTNTVRTYLNHQQSLLSRLNEMEKLPSLDAHDDQLQLIWADSIELLKSSSASQQVELLQRSFNEAEAQIAAARRFHNDAASRYNASLEKFPAVLWVSRAGFKPVKLTHASLKERLAKGLKI